MVVSLIESSDIFISKNNFQDGQPLFLPPEGLTGAPGALGQVESSDEVSLHFKTF